MSIDLFQHLRTVLQRHRLESAGLLVALSGGTDSVCLTRLVARLALEGVTVEIAHVDHGLRPESGEDAAFCRELAQELGLPFHLKTLTDEDYRPGENLQAEARRLRRQWLEDTRTTRGLTAIALAHHEDDQAETVLFRLLRGTGLRGVGAMGEWTAPWFRPLLTIRHEQIERTNREQGWPHREDPTNQTDKYTRNRVRHELLPLADKICPGATGALTRFARLAREDDALITDIAHAELDRLSVREPEGLRFPVQAVAALAPTLRRRLYMAGCRTLGASPEPYSLAHLEEVDALLVPGKPSRRAPVPGPLIFARSYESLWLLDPEKLRIPLSIELDWGIDSEGCKGLESQENIVSVPLPEGRPVGGVRFRARSPGDRLGRHKIKDLLMEARIDRWRRSRALVAEDDEGILALFVMDCGWGCCENKETGKRLWLRKEKRNR